MVRALDGVDETDAVTRFEGVRVSVGGPKTCLVGWVGQWRVSSESEVLMDDGSILESLVDSLSLSRTYTTHGYLVRV